MCVRVREIWEGSEERDHAARKQFDSRFITLFYKSRKLASKGFF